MKLLLLQRRLQDAEDELEVRDRHDEGVVVYPRCRWSTMPLFMPLGVVVRRQSVDVVESVVQDSVDDPLAALGGCWRLMGR